MLYLNSNTMNTVTITYINLFLIFNYRESAIQQKPGLNAWSPVIFKDYVKII